MLILAGSFPLSGEFKLKTYDDYRNNLDKVYDSARYKQNETEWDRFVQSGIETLKTRWISDTEIEIKAELERRLQANGDENSDRIKFELDLIFKENLSKFNEDTQKKKLGEKGAWLAGIISILMPAFNRKALDEVIESKKTEFNSKAINEAFDSWQNETGTVYNSLADQYGISAETSRQATLQKALALAWMKDEALQGFSDELTQRFSDLKKERLRLEEIYLIKKRNSYFYERTADTDSLRRESDSQSAEAIASLILSDASIKADDLMSGALFVSQVEESAAGLPMSPDESEERIRNFIDAGLSSWRQAEEAMLGARLEWERRAFRNFDSADEVWKLNYEKLTQAKNAWLAKARAQIFEGNLLWQAKFDETDSNFEKAISDLDRYIDAQNETWDDYSSGVRQMIVTGSSALSAAAENLAWLTGYRNELAGLNDATSVQLLVKADAQILEWKNTISSFRKILASSELQYHSIDMNDLLTDGRLNKDGTEAMRKYYYSDGTNVLINGSYAVSNDPYLMTSDEFELELLKIEKAYWEERKNRTALVYDYAINDLSRLSKDEQLAKLQLAKLELKTNKDDYEKAINALSGVILPALVTAKENMKNAAEGFSDARRIYDLARVKYEEAMNFVYVLSSPDAMRIAVDDMNEAVNAISSLSNRINDRESEWLLRAKDYYGALSMQEKSESAAIYAQRLKAAIEVRDGLDSAGGYREACRQFEDIVLKNGSLKFSGSNFDEMISEIELKKNQLFKTVTPPVIESENFVTFIKESSDEIAAIKILFETNRNSYYNQQNLISDGSYKEILFQYSNGSIKSESDLQNSLTSILTSCSDKSSSSCSTAIDDFNKSIALDSTEKIKTILSVNSSESNKTKEELATLFYQSLAKIYPDSDPLSVSDNMSNNVLRDYVLSLASKEILNRKTILQSSVISALNSVRKAKDVSDEIVRYLLTDMSIAGNSNDTLAEINKRFAIGNKNISTEKATANIEIASGVKDFLNGFSGDTAPNLYDRIISSALSAINDSADLKTASKNIEIYNYIKNLKTKIILIEKADTDSKAAEYNKLLNESDKIVTLLGYIMNFYSVEIYGLTGSQANDKFTEYKNLIIKPETSAEDREKLSAYIMELSNPGYFNNFFNTRNYIAHTYTEHGKVSALSSYAVKFFSNSFEKTANLKEKGAAGIIADILGITQSDANISEIKSGGITYAKLKEYGSKLTSFVKGEEYGSLPIAIRRSIEETVSSYKSMIRAREIYETAPRQGSATVSAAALKEQKEKYQDLADSAEKIMAGLSEILEVRQNILKSASGESFSKAEGAGRVITSLEKISADIESFKKKISEAEFGAGFSFSLAGDLEDIRKLKNEVYVYTRAYEYIAGYVNGNPPVPLADFQASLLGINMDTEIVERIGSVITKYNIKNNIIEQIADLAFSKDSQDLSALASEFSATTPAGINAEEYKQMYEGLVNEVYAESISAIIGSDENFNALLVDASFRDYGMALHFHEFIKKKFFNKEYKSFEEIFGKIESDDSFSGGDFANLSQYSSSIDYLKTLSANMKKIYYAELANSLSVRVLPDSNTVESYQADNYFELVLHFEKYIEKNYSADLNFDAYLTGFKVLYLDEDPFINEITNNTSNLEGVYNGLLRKDLVHNAELLNGNKAGAYLIEKDYYSALLDSITYNTDFIEMDGFISIYNMNLNASPALASIKNELKAYGNILKLAYDYNRNGAGDIEKFLKDKKVADPRCENFLRLFAIDPALASPEYLTDTTGETDLALSASLLKTAIESMYANINTGIGKTFFNKLPVIGSDKSEAAWLKGEALDVITYGSQGYRHYRDFIETARNKYEVYYNPNDRFQTTAMDTLILSKEGSLKQAENPVSYKYKDANKNGMLDAGENLIDYYKIQHRAEYNALIMQQIMDQNNGVYPYSAIDYNTGQTVNTMPENIENCSGGWVSICISPYAYTAPSDAEIIGIYGLSTFNVAYFADSNSNGVWNFGEKTISEFYNDFRQNGYGLQPLLKTLPANADEMVSDLIHSNMMQYFADSRANELVEEMTMFNRSLLKMVSAAEIEVKDLSQIQVRKELLPKADGTFTNFNTAADGDFGSGGLINSIALAGKIAQIAITDIPGTQKYRASINELLDKVYTTQRAPNAQITRMVDDMLARMQHAEGQISESKQKIRDNGAVLINPGIEEYKKTDDYIKADADYYASDAAFKTAQVNNKNKLEAYGIAKKTYTNHLEIISILFNRLEAARVEFEDEQAVYDYASTAYLYTTGTGVTKIGTDAIKSDAVEDFNQAKAMHDEIVNTYNEVLKRAEKSVLQSPLSDKTYAKLAAELKDKAERAYRIEKTKVLMEREIKARSFDCDQAKDKYEKARESIFPADKQPADIQIKRNLLSDRFIENEYLNGALYSDATFMSLYDNTITGSPKGWTADNILTATLSDQAVAASGALSQLKAFDSPMLEYYNMMRSGQISNVNLNRTINNYQKYKEHSTIATNIYSLVLPVTIVVSGLLAAAAAVCWAWPVGPGIAAGFLIAAGALSIGVSIQLGLISDNNNKASSHISMFNSDMYAFKSKLNNLQNLKITMYEKQASLAEFNQIESLEDESKSGTTAYYDPKTGKNVVKKKYTLKGAFREISRIYGYEEELTEDDLKFLKQDSSIRSAEADHTSTGSVHSSETGNVGDYFNIENYKSDSMVMDEYGNMTMSAGKKFYDALVISNMYSDHLEKKRQDKLKEYYSHTIVMGQAGYSGYTQGYDKAIIGKANEKLFYEIFSETGEEKYKLPVNLKVSDEISARAFNGYTKAAIEYFGAVEGYNTDALLDIESKTGNAEQMLSTFKQYDDSFIGLAEMELAQKKEMQRLKWTISITQLSDKKERWDALTQRILTRGAEQWGAMDAAYREKWKHWKAESENGIIEGQKAWDAKWSVLKNKKVKWFENISKEISEEEMKTRLAEITETVNSFTADVNDRYGNIITNADVGAILADIMKDSPSLLSQDMLDRIKDEDMKFAMTTFTSIKADSLLYGTFSELMNKYEKDIQKTRNLKLIDALTKLLGTLADRILEADADARDTADNYAAGEGYTRSGDQYTSRELLNQQIDAYRQFNFTRSLLVDDADMNKAVMAIDNLPDWQYESMLGILMKQSKIKFESIMDRNVANSLPAHIGNFAQIAASSNFFVGLIGMNDISGGSGEYGRISTQIGNQRNGNNAIMGSLKLAKTVVSLFSGYGAIAIGAVDTLQSAASGEISFDEGMFNAGKGGIMAIGTAVLNNLGPYGKIGAAAINFGMKALKYDNERGLYGEMTQQDAIMGGIEFGMSTAAAGLDKLEGDKAISSGIRRALNFGLDFTKTTFASGIKFDRNGNYTGYGLTGLNFIDGFTTASTNLATSFLSGKNGEDKISREKSYSEGYTIAAGGKFISGLMRGAIYEGYDAITGSNTTAGMGIRNLAYSLDDTVGFFGSYYGGKLVADAKKRAEENEKKKELVAGAFIRPEDEKAVEFLLLSDSSDGSDIKKIKDNFTKDELKQIKSYMDELKDKIRSGEDNKISTRMEYYGMKVAFGGSIDALTETEKKDLLSMNKYTNGITMNEGAVNGNSNYIFKFPMAGNYFENSASQYNAQEHKYGDWGLVMTLVNTMEKWDKESTYPLRINDLGLLGDAPSSLHNGLRHTGVDINLRDKNGNPIQNYFDNNGTINNPINYDREATKRIIDLLINNAPNGYEIKNIYFNDDNLIEYFQNKKNTQGDPVVNRAVGHSNHLDVYVDYPWRNKNYRWNQQ